ncbi:MAG: acyl-CoA thioesterase [Spirochaetaceae bacterium]|jgi:acyl-CoA thioester hydrolase|nr:acyl-CoA thioesterase [Spirochaetaceae bacterium]
MITECILQVRTYECDSYGHVNNAIYLNYLEYARYEFLKAINFDYPAFIKAGYGIFVAHLEIDYKKQAYPDDLLTIQTRPLKKGAVSGTLAQKILRDKESIVEAFVTWACVNTEGIPSKLPPQWNVPGLMPED